MLLTMLMFVFPPLVCEKILLSIYIVALPLSLFYFLKAVDKDKTIFGLLGFMFAYSYLLHWGFYNFVLSIPMFFFTLGYWWKHKDEMSMANIARLYLLLLGTYFCHYESYFLVVLSLSFFAFFSYLYSAFVEIWGVKRESQNDDGARTGNFRTFIGKLKPLLSFVGFMLPIYFIMFSYYLHTTSGHTLNYGGLKQLKKFFFNMSSLVYFRDDHILIGRILLCLLGVVFLLTLWYRIREVFRFRKSASISQSTGPKERLWMKIIDGKEQFLLMAGILTIIFFKSPWNVSSGGAWIATRVHIYIFLVLLPFFGINFHKIIRYAIAGIIITLSLWHLGYSVYDYYYLNKDIAEMASAAGMLEEHSTFDSRPAYWHGPAAYHGKVKYVGEIFVHIPNYFCLENDVAYLSNYEATFDYFPVDFKDGLILERSGTNTSLLGYSEPTDYLLVWRTGNNEVEDLEDNYDLIHSNNYNELYRRKKAKPDENLPETK